MKKPLLISLVFIVLVTTNSCKKNDKNNVMTGTVSNGQATVPSDAAGAFYAIRQTATGSLCGSFTNYSAYAWFGNYTGTQYVNSLSVNGTPMTDSLEGVIPSAWYEIDPSMYTLDLSLTPVAWVSSGNSAVSIPAINYTDQSNFPGIAYNLPSSVSAASTLNISINVSGADSGIVVGITGGTSGLSYYKNYNPSATSVSFLPAELAKVIGPGDELAVQIMPVSYFSQTYAGKKYYFVKQNALAQCAGTY